MTQQTTLPPTSPTSTNPSSSAAPNRPRVGVGVFILRPSTAARPSPNGCEFIIGRRLGSHGANTWALPGGHLELDESFETCAAREVLEETGLHLKNIRFLTCTNDVMADEAKHYITVFMMGEVDAEPSEGREGEERRPSEPEVLEPEKCAGWEWISWERVVRWAENVDGVDCVKEDGSIAKQGKLFLPLLNLVRQRPGVVPSIY